MAKEGDYKLTMKMVGDYARYQAQVFTGGLWVDSGDHGSIDSVEKHIVAKIMWHEELKDLRSDAIAEVAEYKEQHYPLDGMVRFSATNRNEAIVNYVEMHGAFWSEARDKAYVKAGGGGLTKEQRQLIWEKLALGLVGDAFWEKWDKTVEKQ